MKRRRFIKHVATVLLVALLVPAAGQIVPVRRAARIPAAAAASFFVTETFDANEFDLGWTETGTVNGNYTTTPAPLQGTESCYMGVTEAYIDLTFTGRDEVYGKFVAHNINNANNPFFFLLKAGASSELSIILWNDEKVYLRNGTVEGAASSWSWTEGQTRYFWFRYKKGTGSNGIATLWSATTDSKPGSPDISVTTGNSTTQPTSVRLYCPGAAELIFDHVRLSDTTFN